MSSDGLSCGWLVAVDGYRAAGERRPTAAPTARDDRGSRMIAPAAPAAPAEADFSRSDRRRATGSVLDDRNARRPFAFRARISGARSAALFDLLRAK